MRGSDSLAVAGAPLARAGGPPGDPRAKCVLPQAQFLGRRWNGYDVPRPLLRTRYFSLRDNPAGLANRGGGAAEFVSSGRGVVEVTVRGAGAEVRVLANE